MDVGFVDSCRRSDGVPGKSGALLILLWGRFWAAFAASLPMGWIFVRCGDGWDLSHASRQIGVPSIDAVPRVLPVVRKNWNPTHRMGHAVTNAYSWWSPPPVSNTDPSGLDWHHIFPQANWPGYSRAAQDAFDNYDSQVRTPNKHGWSKGHVAYNQATKELGERFCRATNITLGQMTA